jgi:hypothetical protein
LALIPKGRNVVSFSIFRPISLCNVSYKIITKIIASEIQKLMLRLISPSQGGFVAQRQISDSIVLVQEAIHSSKSRGDRGMAIKIDMENAFDRVRHSFLLAVLAKFGLHPSFIRWIATCIKSLDFPIDKSQNFRILPSFHRTPPRFPPIAHPLYFDGRISRMKFGT